MLIKISLAVVGYFMFLLGIMAALKQTEKETRK